MVKRVLFVLCTFAVLSPIMAFAGSWSIHCENTSCVASQGSLKVYWVSTDMGNNIYSGELRGVEGIPVTVEDYEGSEKKIEASIEKSITKKKSSSSQVSVTPKELRGPDAAKSEEESVFTKKHTMTQTAAGKKATVNYNLALLKYIGDNWYPFYKDNSIRKYWGAAELLVNEYMNGNIQGYIDAFFYQKNCESLDSVPIDSKVNDDSRDAVLIKYIALAKFSGIEDGEKRYSLAASKVFSLLLSKSKEDEQELKNIGKEYTENMRKLGILTKPGETVLNLYKKDKELAFIKWIGDTQIRDYITDPKDRYIIALVGGKSLDEETRKKFSEQFETAIANKDQSVTMVTFKGPALPVSAIIVLAITVIIGAVAFAFVSRKRKSKISD